MKIDKKTIKLIRQGDPGTIEYIYSSYYKVVKYHVYEIVRNNEDAEELTQDVFLKVFDRIGQYDEKKIFITWLISIARNTAIDHLRQKRPDIEYVQDISIFCNDENDSLCGELDKKMRDLLSKEDYTIVTYRVYFDLKFADISSALEMSVPTVTAKYYKAIRKLKKEIEEEDFYD